MCGIVGYVGLQEAAPILLDGLKKLEYRGYDSAGIAVLNGDTISVNKVTGRIAITERIAPAVSALVIPVGLHTVLPPM